MQSLISNFYKYKSAVLLGICCAFFCMLVGHFLGFLLFLAGVPIFFSYLSYGQEHGLVTSVTTTLLIAIVAPIASSCDIFLSIIMPSAVVGHLSLRNISSKRKNWWYPESFILQNLTLLFAVILIITSFTFRTEEAILKIHEEAIKVMFADKADYYLNLISPTLHGIVKYYNGFALFFSMCGALCSRQIAFAIGKRLQTNIRPKFDYSNAAISNWMAIFSLVAFTLSKIFPTFSYVFCGLSVVGLFAPMACGFSIISFMAQKKKLRRLPLLTILFGCLFPLHLVTFLAIIGIIDSFYSIRQGLSQ